MSADLGIVLVAGGRPRCRNVSLSFSRRHRRVPADPDDRTGTDSQLTSQPEEHGRAFSGTMARSFSGPSAETTRPLIVKMSQR